MNELKSPEQLDPVHTHSITFKYRRKEVTVVFTIEYIRCYGEPSGPMLERFNDKLSQLVLARCRAIDAKEG